MKKKITSIIIFNILILAILSCNNMNTGSSRKFDYEFNFVYDKVTKWLEIKKIKISEIKEERIYYGKSKSITCYITLSEIERKNHFICGNEASDLDACLDIEIMNWFKEIRVGVSYRLGPLCPGGGGCEEVQCTSKKKLEKDLFDFIEEN